MSVTIFGAGAAGVPIRDGGFRMRSALGTACSALVLAIVVDVEGVSGTELDDEPGSGAGGLATS
jgi:hypothetical protein